MNLVGVDVFIYWTGTELPDVPKSLGALRLELISNRGTKVWPTTAARLDYTADEWRCRYTTETNQPVGHGDINALLAQLTASGKFWTRAQTLALLPDGSRGFSQPY